MAINDLKHLLNRFCETTLPGCACVIMKGDEPLYEVYAGWADMEEKKPIHEHSIFRQWSSTKLFTYAIAMQLFEAGEFLLSDPLYEYLPEWRDTRKFVELPNGELTVRPLDKPLTIRDAITMACGMPYCAFAMPETPLNPTLAAMNEVMKVLCADGKRPTMREQVRGMANCPVMFEPGTHWYYGFGSEMITALIEEITGKSLRRNMQERLIDPMDMRDTGTLLDAEQAKCLVANYAVTPEGLKKLPPEDDGFRLAGGVDEYERANLSAGCKDFAKFMAMLANGGKYKGERYLGRKTIDLMRENYLNADQLRDFHSTYLNGYGYGLGVRTLMDKAHGNHNGSLGAFGWTGGAGIWAESDPTENIAIVYMHNTVPNQEEYHHLRVRAAAYSCIE